MPSLSASVAEDRCGAFDYESRFRPAAFPAVAGFLPWKNIRISMSRLGKICKWVVPVWQNSYLDYSVLVKFTDLFWHCALEKMHVTDS